MPDLPPPEECANCGSPIPRGARACPECGADERTGWREVSVYDAIDLPADSSTDRAGRNRRAGFAWYWWLVALGLLVLLLLGGVVFR